MIPSRQILGIRVDATNYAEATQQVIAWARQMRSCYVCLATVNNIMTARASSEYGRVMEEAALVTSDGMPLVWMLRALGLRQATRVYGPQLTPLVLAGAARHGIPVGFYGGSPEVLHRLCRRVQADFPEIRIGYAFSPPFRPLTIEEDDEQTRAIRESGVRILFVGLGSPKQDRWMHQHVGKIDAVMLGVGAAFDFLSGSKRQAPAWLQSSGLEWAFRLCAEPRRLWRRYLSQNPRFAMLAVAQLLEARVHSSHGHAWTRVR